MASHSHEPQVTVLPPNKEKIKKLWTVALIMLLVTIAEFIVAFSIPHEFGATRVGIFVLMTIVKAGYIVGEFMHLRYEVKILFWTVIIPMVFVIWMLVAFVYEGLKLADLRI